MRLSRFFVLLILLCVVVSNANAFDTAGKFGMGVRFWGTPIITFSNVRFGISNQIGFEPSIGYHTWKNKYDSDSESSTNLLLFSTILNLNTIKAERSNFHIKFGGVYSKMTSKYSFMGSESSSTTTGFAILGGFGIEHFVNDNFGINVGTLSGFWTSSPDDSDASFSLTSFSSQLVDFSLVWYLR